MPFCISWANGWYCFATRSICLTWINTARSESSPSSDNFWNIKDSTEPLVRMFLEFYNI